MIEHRLPTPDEVTNMSRRALLRAGALAGGGLVLGVWFPRLAPVAWAQEPGAPAGVGYHAPNAFVRIGTDESITIVANHSEMGQGTYTSIAMTLAEELDADWERVRVEAAPVDPAYNHPAFGMQATGGSTSTWVEWDRLRKAGASARHMLVAAAAAAWQVEASSCRAEDGRVLHPDSKREATYGSLAEAASRLAPPAEVPLKARADWKLLGTPRKRLDTPEKTNGKAIFGIDVSLPGMLVALVLRPPTFGGKVKSFDATRAKAIAGVRHVVQIERGIAVVADGFWPANLGREALDVTWDEGPNARLDSRAQGEEYVALAGRAGKVARSDGDAASALAKCSKLVGGVFDLPYLAHAPMEPLNAVADVRADSCEVWTGTQFQTIDHAAAAQDAGLPPAKVKLHTTLLGGGFGRRAALDAHFVREAVQLSKRLGVPIKVIWTREDDIRGGHYRPRAVHAVRAGLDAAGKVAWEHRIVCQSFMAGTTFEPFVFKDGIDHTAVEGASDTRYAIPDLRVEWHRAPDGVTTHFWRSVGHSHTSFAVESVIDELAHAAGEDPVAFRLELLGDARCKGVVEAVAKLAKWGETPPEGRARGVAVHESFGSYVAHVAEVSVSAAGALRVHRFWTAIDVGPVVNPDTVRAQMEGAVVFGLSAAMYGEITLEGGRVKQRNFHDYPLLRMHEMPTVEVAIVESDQKMGGAGEPGVPPVAPALCNAIFAATGKRVRTLPLSHVDLRRA